MKEKIVKLYQEHRELTILEWAYLLIAVVSVFTAGLLALFNQSIGVAILIVPLIAVVAFTMNVVSWALIKLIIEATFPELKQLDIKKAESKSVEKKK